MKRAITITLLLLYNLTLLGQMREIEKNSQIYFKKGESLIDLDYLSNRESINDLLNLINSIKSDSLYTITRVNIEGYSSPEGDLSLNNRLALSRANYIRDYLLKSTDINDSLITKTLISTDWDGLLRLVELSNMEHKDDVINIIKNVPEETKRKINPNDKWYTVVDSRNKHLMELKGGEPYNFMISNFHPYLRRASVVTIYFRSNIPNINNLKRDSLAMSGIVSEHKNYSNYSSNSIISSYSSAANNENFTKPLLAIKTNLLFNVASLINVELEYPIKNNWSISGEWIFPWWSSCGDNANESSKRNTLQLLNGNIEGKYWFRDADYKPVLTGWFAGVYAGGGMYDFERRTKGYQGELFITAGLSGGFAHTINKNGDLRMEYSLGIGYLKSNYRYYEEHFGNNDLWHTVKKESGNFRWLGPTKAKVSLVWMLNKVVRKEK